MGYITGITQDLCQALDFWDSKEIRENSCSDHELPDHLFFGPTCSKYNNGPGTANSPNYMFSNNWNSNSRHCFMGEHLAETNFRYVKSFFEAYKGKRKYFTYRTITMHNVYAELSHDFDTILVNFLKDLMGENGSKEPLLVVRFYADHGDHKNLIKLTDSGDLERHMPTMLTAIPKLFLHHHKSEKLEETFERNSKRLTTTMDPFWTDLGIIGGRTNPSGEKMPYGWLVNQVREERSKVYQENDPSEDRVVGIDLFGEEVPNEKFCEDIPFHPDYLKNMKFHCRCKQT
jgi:hypothetical protein